jgi:hypothetical protein
MLVLQRIVVWGQYWMDGNTFQILVLKEEDNVMKVTMATTQP